ncbi:MAG TPA: hypothetical protein VMR33_15135 [Candidatus Baltobacteraceae bacterium]|jgi:hypothetical protein|nr:hypothetical protein [Candidatus Baltobacteraceae bacterium]
MKTPRELLLGRHQSARPHLDQIRQDIIDKIGARRPFFALRLWQELILPARRAWICLGAAWVVVLTLNLMTGRDASVSVHEPGPMNPDSIIALQRQERLMAQLLEEDNAPASPANAPEQRPRSEAPVEQKIV